MNDNIQRNRQVSKVGLEIGVMGSALTETDDRWAQANPARCLQKKACDRNPGMEVLWLQSVVEQTGGRSGSRVTNATLDKCEAQSVMLTCAGRATMGRA
jgi:hypothetical protein